MSSKKNHNNRSKWWRLSWFIQTERLQTEYRRHRHADYIYFSGQHWAPQSGPRMKDHSVRRVCCISWLQTICENFFFYIWSLSAASPSFSVVVHLTVDYFVLLISTLRSCTMSQTGIGKICINYWHDWWTQACGGCCSESQMSSAGSRFTSCATGTERHNRSHSNSLVHTFESFQLSSDNVRKPENLERTVYNAVNYRTMWPTIPLYTACH